MKWRKAASGVLAYVLAFTTAVSAVPASTVSAAQSGGIAALTGETPSETTEIGVPEFIVPEIKEGDHYSHIETGIKEEEKKLLTVIDRAENPAEFTLEDEDDGEKAKFLDGKWGFNQKIVSTDDRFNVTGNTVMVISFDLYLNTLDVEYSGNNCPTLMAKGDQQYSVDVMNKGLRTHSKVASGWENRPSSDCFPQAKKWYHVDIVYGKNGKEQHYIDGKATGALQNASAIQEQENAPFTIGFRYENDNTSGNIKANTVFSEDKGYLADVKFYNGSLQPEIQNGVDLTDWNEEEDKGYARLSDLLDRVKPVSDFSVDPYVGSVAWSDAAGRVMTAADRFQCGTVYQATKTLTASEGYVFPENVSKEDIVMHIPTPVTYKKIKGLTATADSQETNSSSDLPAYGAVDGDEATHWHSNHSGSESEKVQGEDPDGDKIWDLTGNNTYTITLPEEKEILKFEYVARTENGTQNGDIYEAILQVSTDGTNFTDIEGASFGFATENKLAVKFDKPVQAKAIRIVGKKAYGRNGCFMSAKEFYLYSSEIETQTIEKITGLTGDADSYANSGNDQPASGALDDDLNTLWHSFYANSGGNGEYVKGIERDNDIWDLTGNNTFTITLPTAEKVQRFEYVGRGGNNGDIYKAHLEYSTTAEGDNFRLIEGSEFGYESSVFAVDFTPVVAKRIRIVGEKAYSNDGSHAFMSAKEFRLFKAVALPTAPTVSSASVSEDRKNLTVTFEYPAMDCDSFINSIAFRSPVNLEVGDTYQINPSEVFAADGQKIDNHPALHAEYFYECSDSSTIIVSSNGRVTAIAEGPATVTVTAEAGDTRYTCEVKIKVYDKDTMLLHPELIYVKPEAGKYPEVADVRMNVTRDDPYMGVITEMVEGGSTLELDKGDVVIERHDGVVGFNGIYKATGVDKQFNAVETDPLVITFKLYLKRLPRDQREHTILSKGNQYNLSYMNPAGTDDVILRLQVGNGWTKWQRTIKNTDIQKWLDIMIVADGKNTADSIKLYVGGVPVEKTSGNGTSIGAADPSSSELRPFTLCDKPGETDPMDFGADLGLISGLKVYDVKHDAPSLVDAINIKTLGAENAAAAIKTMLDNVTPSSYMTATPYSIKTSWYAGTGDDKTALDGKTAFQTSDLVNKGYTAVTVLKANKKADGSYYEFDKAEEEHINEQLLHIFTKDDTENECKDTMILRKATVSDDQTEMTVEISFLPTGIPAPKLTFTAPRVGLVPRDYPILGDSSSTRRYDFSEDGTKWYSVTGDGTKTALSDGTGFTEITADNKYQVETVLVARDNYRFDTGSEYKAEVEKTVKLQRSGNVEAKVTAEALEDGAKLKITVLYEKPIYTVTFDLNGLAEEPFRQAVSTGRTAIEPEAPVREGYRFDQWCSDSNTHAEFDFATAITESITLHAHWTKIYKVEYVTNRSDITMESAMYEADVPTEEPQIERPEGDASKVDFAGWYTDESLREGTKYTFGETLNNDITLYAKWTAEVIYNENYEGAQEHEAITTVINSQLSGLSELKRTGYRFDGWYTDAACSDGKEVDLSKGVTSHTTLYAKWVQQVTVSFDPGEEASEDTQIEKQVIDKGSRARKPSDPKPKESTKIFVSWFEKDTEGNYKKDPYNFDAAVESDLTLYAQWADNNDLWTVTFKIDNEAKAVQYVLKNGTEGAKTTPPEIPAEPYKTLNGWYKDEACTEKFDFTAENITADTTLYAKWDAVYVNISFAVNGGTDVASVKVPANAALKESELPVPVRTGYEFAGWFMDQELKTSCEGQVVTSDTRLYAKWNAKQLEGVTVTSQKNITLAVNGTSDVAYDLSPRDVRGVTVSFTSGDESVATVSNQGTITAKALGETVITVSAVQGDITKQDTINVKVARFPTNIAGNAEATTNNTENDQHVAANINDGRSNTKWASDVWGGNDGGLASDGHDEGAKRYRDWSLEENPGHHSVWVTYEWPEEITFQKTVLNWERRNTGKYTLEVSSDGKNWKTIYAKDLAKANIRQDDAVAETIVLNKPVTAKYLRVDITKIYAKSGDWESEGGNGWSGCGIYEWDVFDIAEEGCPVFTNPEEVGTEVSAVAGTAFEYIPAAGDAAISVTTDMTGMNGAKFENGKFSWTPQLQDVGTYYVTFKAEKDDKASFQTVVLKVEEDLDPDEDDKEAQKRARLTALANAEEIDMETGASIYTEETWRPFKTAYDELKNLTDAEIDAMSAKELKEKVDALTKAQGLLTKTAASEKDEAVEAANEALKEAEKINFATEKSKYTEKSWQAFIDAYNALNNLTPEQITNMSAQDLQKLTIALIEAQKALAMADVEVSTLNMSAKKYQFAKNKKINMAQELSVLPENATNKNVTWSSSNTKVATIDPATGQLKTKKKVGKTKITATSSNGKKVTVTVQVMKGAVRKVQAKGKKKLTVKAGKTVTLKTAIMTKGGKANKKLKWSSSDPTVATVGKGKGAAMKVKIAKNAKQKTVKITAISTDGTNKKAVFTIKVK